MKRIHIPNHGPDEGNVTTGIATALNECQEIGATQIVLITPVRDNLDSIIIGRILGEPAAKRLMKGGVISIADSEVEIIHHSMTTAVKARNLRVGLVFYVSGDNMKKLDSLPFDVLLYVPWLTEEGQAWATKWGAETLGGSTLNEEVDLPKDVTEALTRLSRSINLSAGLAHPSDLAHAKGVFSGLKAKKLRFSAAEIEKWAVRNGWKTAHAEELAKLAGR
jgi:hypothetical protein